MKRGCSKGHESSGRGKGGKGAADDKRTVSDIKGQDLRKKAVAVNHGRRRNRKWNLF